MTENTMTLEQVRDWHREQSKKNRLRIPPNYEEALPHEDMADAIDRHLTGPCSPNYRKSAFLIGFEFARDAHLSRPVSMSDEDVERACKTIFPRTWDAYGKVVDDPRTANVRAALEADRAGRGVDLRAELELLVADMLQPHAFTPAHYARQIEKMLAQGNGGVRDGWIKSYPVVAGYYLVRGFCLGDNLRHALVEVRDIEGSLCCNLHERNSDDEPDDWFAVADMSDRFQWKLLAASPQPDAEGGV